MQMDDTYDIFVAPLYSWLPCDPDITGVRQKFKDTRLNELLENEENDKQEAAQFHHAKETHGDLSAPMNTDFEGKGSMMPPKDEKEQQVLMKEKFKESASAISMRERVNEVFDEFQKKHPAEITFNPAPIMGCPVLFKEDEVDNQEALITSFNSDQETEFVIDRKLDEDIKRFIREEGLKNVYENNSVEETDATKIVLKSDVKIEQFKDFNKDLQKLEETIKRLMVEEGLTEEEARAHNRIQIAEPPVLPDKEVDPEDVVPIPKKIEKHVKIEDQMTTLTRLKEAGLTNEQIRRIMSGDASEEDFI